MALGRISALNISRKVRKVRRVSQSDCAQLQRAGQGIENTSYPLASFTPSYLLTFAAFMNRMRARRIYFTPLRKKTLSYT
jgi:hypothetical protein